MQERALEAGQEENKKSTHTKIQGGFYADVETILRRYGRRYWGAGVETRWEYVADIVSLFGLWLGGRFLCWEICAGMFGNEKTATVEMLVVLLASLGLTSSKLILLLWFPVSCQSRSMLFFWILFCSFFYFVKNRLSVVSFVVDSVWVKLLR